MLRDKESQLMETKTRLATIQADHSASDSALTSLETSLAEREKQIERYIFILLRYLTTQSRISQVRLNSLFKSIDFRTKACQFSQSTVS